MSRFYPLRIQNVQRDTRDAAILTFEVPEDLEEAFRFLQGQHLTLRTKIHGEDVRRSYSICSAVQDGRLRVAVKRVPGGVFSTWVNESLRPGEIIEVMPPMGHFNLALDAAHGKHYVAFAAGSGITPVFSILKTTLLTEPNSRFTLFYGNRASSAVMLKEELLELKDIYLDRLNLVFVMSREPQDIELLNGRMDRRKCDELIERYLSGDEVDAAFVCGPGGMMDDAAAALQAHGLARERVKIEMFATSIPKHAHVPHAQPLPGAQECEVTVVQDGVRRRFTLEKDKEPLLDAALRQGIDLPYSCKGGVCSTCRCKLIEGEVDMDANFALEDYEVARGFILTCQSYPVTDRLTIDLDQGA